ncbi:hypothetical protein EYF80_010053 [Liparis tanakae]|uniref:Uncharacterized protein n=1 Tax=Liparis tanakae TaxID=230148 RepID=A0A4Z2INS0_9TELE|nr:hypothetical protein EYF80_010053 [Liparis tanakae]
MVFPAARQAAVFHASIISGEVAEGLDGHAHVSLQGQSVNSPRVNGFDGLFGSSHCLVHVTYLGQGHVTNGLQDRGTREFPHAHLDEILEGAVHVNVLVLQLAASSPQLHLLHEPGGEGNCIYLFFWYAKVLSSSVSSTAALLPERKYCAAAIIFPSSN